MNSIWDSFVNPKEVDARMWPYSDTYAVLVAVGVTVMMSLLASHERKITKVLEHVMANPDAYPQTGYAVV